MLLLVLSVILFLALVGHDGSRRRCGLERDSARNRCADPRQAMGFPSSEPGQTRNRSQRGCNRDSDQHDQRLGSNSRQPASIRSATGPKASPSSRLSYAFGTIAFSEIIPKALGATLRTVNRSRFGACDLGRPVSALSIGCRIRLVVKQAHQRDSSHWHRRTDSFARSNRPPRRLH